MRVLVPFAATDPKTRLSGLLDADERRAFARAMLADVLDAVRATDREPTVLATADVAVDAPVVVDERPLTDAVNARLPDAAGDPVAIVMADLALATPEVLERLFDTEGDVVLAPGRGGGTNAMVIRHPDFAVDYHGASIRDHRRIAREAGATLAEVDSFRLAADVDDPDDCVEVLLHTDGRARAWLEAAGIELADDEGRVTVRRGGEGF
jgi:2-phospho-L-lactate guanylyltransferase